MCLKWSFCDYKWVLQSILCMTVSSNSISGSSNFDTAFLLDCTKSFSVFSGYWIGNLMRIPKMFLKLSFCDTMWVLQSILSMTASSNSISGSSNLDTAFLLDCIKSSSVFSGNWIGNLMRIPKMFLKLSFSDSKWVLQSILSMTVSSNSVSGSKFSHRFSP